MIASQPAKSTQPTFVVEDHHGEQPRLTVQTDELTVVAGTAVVRIRWSEEGAHVAVVRSPGFDVELEDLRGDVRIGVDQLRPCTN